MVHDCKNVKFAFMLPRIFIPIRTTQTHSKGLTSECIMRPPDKGVSIKQWLPYLYPQYIAPGQYIVNLIARYYCLANNCLLIYSYWGTWWHWNNSTINTNAPFAVSKAVRTAQKVSRSVSCWISGESLTNVFSFVYLPLRYLRVVGYLGKKV